jgi:Tol biopolymer transport system component
MFTKSMLIAMSLTLASISEAAVPGEMIAIYNASGGKGGAVVSPDGSNFAYRPCVGDPTRGGVPRYFLSVGGGGTVLHLDLAGMPDRWSNELVAADEDCLQTIILSNEGNKVIYDRKWSPDGRMVALSAEEFNPATYQLVNGGIYLADVVYNTDGRPTGVSSFRQVVETNGNTALDWSPDGSKIVYGGPGIDGDDLFVYTPGTFTSVKITNTPGRGESRPTWSANGRIAYDRVSEVSRNGNGSDIFSIPEGGGAEVRITSKSTTGSPVNMQPCYSPDGQYLSFTSGSQPTLSAPNGDKVLYRIKADGTGKPIKIIGGKGQSWSFNRWRR